MPSQTMKQIPPSDEPTKVAEYNIIKRIGWQDIADLYLAEHSETKQRVMIKLVSLELQQDMSVEQRFWQEAEALKNLDNPNIMQLYSCGQCSICNRLYLAMEHIDGGSLKMILAAGVILPEKKALNISLAIARALEHAHFRGIIHRDLKPLNIWIARKTQKIKVSNWALSKIADRPEIVWTKEMKTPSYYMPPEQIMDVQTVTPQADLYALGAILYHLLAGKPPYSEHKGIEAMAEAKLSVDPIPIEEHVPSVGASLIKVLRKALNRDIQYRYSTATDMIADLEIALIEQQERPEALPRDTSPHGTITQRMEAALIQEAKESEFPFSLPPNLSQTSPSVAEQSQVGSEQSQTASVNWTPVYQESPAEAVETQLPLEALGDLPTREPIAPDGSESLIEPIEQIQGNDQVESTGPNHLLEQQTIQLFGQLEQNDKNITDMANELLRDFKLLESGEIQAMPPGTEIEQPSVEKGQESHKLLFDHILKLDRNLIQLAKQMKSLQNLIVPLYKVINKLKSEENQEREFLNKVENSINSMSNQFRLLNQLLVNLESNTDQLQKNIMICLWITAVGFVLIWITILLGYF